MKQNQFKEKHQSNFISSWNNSLIFDFSTLHTTIPPSVVIIVFFSETVEICFKIWNSYLNRFSSTSTIYWEFRDRGKKQFTEASLINLYHTLQTKCSFAIGDTAIQQDLGISTSIDPVSFWGKLFLYCLSLNMLNSLFYWDH